MINFNNRIILATEYFGTAYSDNEGLSWIDSLDNGSLDGLIVSGQKIYANSSPSMVYSDDGGLDWSWATEGGVSTGGLECSVGNIAANNETVIANEFCSNYSPLNSEVLWPIIYSIDTGRTFALANAPSTYYLTNMAVLGSKAFAIGQAFIRSDDRGANWYVDSTLNQNTYTAIYTVEPKFVILGADSGKILFSSDTGNTWTDITGNLPAPATQFYYLGTSIYAITDYLGMWHMDAEALGVPNNYVNTSNLANNGILLYPNPTQTSINIVLTDYTLTTGNASIKIYNSLGQQVFSGQAPLSSGTFTLPTNNFLKGVYYLQVTGFGNSRVAKFVID